MEIVRHDPLSWEPLVLRLRTSIDAVALVPSLRDLVSRWFSAREAIATCSCFQQYLNVVTDLEGTPHGVAVHCEWVCKKCLPSLLATLEAEMPQVRQVEVGEPRGVAPESVSGFVSVPAKDVLLEDGSVVRAGPFRVSRCPVTIGDFEEFVKATGYVTTAERNGDTDTFREHCALELLTEEEKSLSDANNVSYLDATRYCEWRGRGFPRKSNGWPRRSWTTASSILSRNETCCTMQKVAPGLDGIPMRWKGSGRSGPVRLSPMDSLWCETGPCMFGKQDGSSSSPCGLFGRQMPTASRLDSAWWCREIARRPSDDPSNHATN